MIIVTPNPYTLAVKPSAREPGRFGWVIRRDGAAVRRSSHTFGSQELSAENGDAALKEVVALWRDAG